jgi:hypothetical protein
MTVLDPLRLLTGAGLLATGFVVGTVNNHRTKPKHRTPEAVCGCGHHLAQHDPVTNECHDRRIQMIMPT